EVAVAGVAQRGPLRAAGLRLLRQRGERRAVEPDARMLAGDAAAAATTAAGAAGEVADGERARRRIDGDGPVVQARHRRLLATECEVAGDELLAAAGRGHVDRVGMRADVDGDAEVIRGTA